MEVVAVVEAMAAGKLFKEPFGNTLSNPKGKAQGKTTINSSSVPGKSVSMSPPIHTV